MSSASKYGDKISEICNNGCISFALSIAKDTGILPTLLSASKPMTSQEIADANKLKERYVREVLGSLTAAKLVRLQEDESGDSLYFLNDDEKRVLEDSGIMPCISFTMSLASVYSKVRACFALDGPYGHHYGEEAHQVIGEFNMLSYSSTISTFLRHVPELVRKLEAGIDVIEFGCGCGNVISELATKYPNSRFTASEVNSDLTEKLKAKWGHISNLAFEEHNICHLSEDLVNKYDWVMTVDVIHDLPNPQGAVASIRKTLKEPGGVYTFVEPVGSSRGTHKESVGNMSVAGFYALSVFMCLPESFQEPNSAALGPCAGRNVMVDIIKKANFDATCHELDDMFTLFVAKVPGAREGVKRSAPRDW
ncbi:uncharacterized protein LOC101863009 isoform X2 [Aplysia californica]|uniref:Uncharacterized protein LOC101863009 isoform X2 n=1 Tax=Aplysia californica TaxID=6500 RepID=A0ABM0JIH6_APLCA|nr:uncharacterized protein LOC101863009 isoform X2 [Aplysia californica]